MDVFLKGIRKESTVFKKQKPLKKTKTFNTDRGCNRRPYAPSLHNLRALSKILYHIHADHVDLTIMPIYGSLNERDATSIYI